jgi:biopolymer transport protein ExbD
MAIYTPGIRDRHNRQKRNGKRNVVAMLSLTAMVDMFTVLAVFLLQNYQTTGEVIELSDDVVLPKASAVKELKPAHVVLISPSGVSLDKVLVIPTAEVKAAQDWEIQPLITAVTVRFKEVEDSQKMLGLEKLRDAVDETKPDVAKQDPNDLRRITVQADKSIDFLTIKKVMYTLYQAGAAEINFAVMKNEKPRE